MIWRQAISRIYNTIKLQMMMPSTRCSLSPLHYYQIALSPICLPLVKQIQVQVAAELTSRPDVPNKLVRCASFHLYIHCGQLQVSLWSAYQMLTRRWKLLQPIQWISSFALFQNFYGGWANADSERSQQLIGAVGFLFQVCNGVRPSPSCASF